MILTLKSDPLLRQWLLNRDFLDVYDELQPGEVSFTWFHNKLDSYRSRDPGSTVGKMSRLDHILATPNLLSSIQSVEHVRVGRDVPDHKAVVIHLDWSHTTYGKGVFRSGANTQKDPIYQKQIHITFSNDATADSLR